VSHDRRLDHLIVTGPGIRLQDRRQRQPGRRHRRLPLRPVSVSSGQLSLELLIEQLVAMLT
jgi:hypothetical protein